MNSTITYNIKAVTEKWFVLKILLIGIFIFSTVGAFAQERVVSGTVIDNASGEGLPGATVAVKGTTNGTITDIDGKFQLSVGDGAIIVVSFVGYKNQELAVGSQTSIKIILKEDVAQLAEVVVVGYGEVEKEDVTGSIVSVGTEEFNKGIVTSPERLLAGKVPGVSVISNSGEPGGGSQIRIRGATSINASSDPLIVIDGVPLDGNGVAGSRNPLNFINPADIADITVLKDASAAAIYGSRAANGVILVTTKTGDPGKIKLNYDAFYSVSTFTSETGELSPNNFRAIINNKAPQEIGNLGNANTKWVDEITRPATGLKQMISASGGFENHRFYGSVNYLKNEGVLKTSSNENTNLGLKYNGKFLNDDLKVNLNTKYGLTKDRFAPNVLGTAMFFDPTQPVMDGNSETGGYFQWDDALAPRNPVATIELTDNTGKSTRFLGNLELEYSIPVIEGLSVKVNGSTDRLDGKNENFQPRLLNIYTGAADDSGRFSQYEETRTSRLLEVYSIYKSKVNSIDLRYDLTAGYSWQNFEFERFEDVVTNNTTDIDIKDTVRTENRLISFFGRANFELKNKYLLTVNLRRDGSTRFGDSNKWGLFPSLALGWRVIDESFAEPLQKVFSDLKFRVGFGVIGNQAIPDYKYLPFYNYSDDRALYQFGYNPDGSARYVRMIRPFGVDPAIQWEETRTTNFGIDFGFFQGRLTGAFDYYEKQTTELIFEAVIAAGLLPADRVLTNIGEMSNKGVELLLNAVVIDKQDLKLNTTFNIARNTNKIEKLDGGNFRETGGISGDVGQTIQAIQVGNPINSFRTYIQDPNGVALQGVEYRDINNDGQITDLDRVIDKNPAPDFTLGLTNNLSFKKFDLAFTFRGSFGNYVYNNVASANGYYEKLGDRITQNIHSSALETNFNRRQLFSDYYIEDASFIKLDNITLGFNTILKDIRFRFYTTFQNVFVITGYSGVDPEIASGIDNNLYPRSLTSLFGVSISY